MLLLAESVLSRLWVCADEQSHCDYAVADVSALGSRVPSHPTGEELVVDATSLEKEPKHLPYVGLSVIYLLIRDVIFT
jgi:hypothetical protein